MLIAQTPLRVSFIGGGSDFFDYYSRFLGKVCSVTIDKYVYVIIKERYDDKIYLNYSKKEIVDSVDEIQHELVRECMKKVGIEKGIEITTLSDIPSEGSGLGSSSAMVVCLLNALYTFVGNPQPKEILATQANEIEICSCHRSMGIQDAYASAYGSLRTYTFGQAGDVVFQPYDRGEAFLTTQELVNIEDKELHSFKKHLMLIWTGLTRKSSTILEEQQEKTASFSNDEYLHEMVGMVDRFVSCLERSEFDQCGLLLNEAWQLKKNISSNISNPTIDTIYDTILRLGALGGKIAGAGNGGFILAYVPPEKQQLVRNYIDTQGLREMPFDFEQWGTRILLNNPTHSW